MARPRAHLPATPPSPPLHARSCSSASRRAAQAPLRRTRRTPRNRRDRARRMHPRAAELSAYATRPSSAQRATPHSSAHRAPAHPRTTSIRSPHHLTFSVPDERHTALRLRARFVAHHATPPSPLRPLRAAAPPPRHESPSRRANRGKLRAPLSPLHVSARAAPYPCRAPPAAPHPACTAPRAPLAAP